MDLAHRTFDEQLNDAVAWLALYARPGGAGWPVFSYALKHAIARDVGAYVSSTAVVEAARLAGYGTVGTPTRAGNAWLALAVRIPRKLCSAGRSTPKSTGHPDSSTYSEGEGTGP